MNNEIIIEAEQQADKLIRQREESAYQRAKNHAEQRLTRDLKADAAWVLSLERRRGTIQ